VATSLEGRVFASFKDGILRTAVGRAGDVIAVVGAITWEFLSKPITVWQYLLPPIAVLCTTFAVHLGTATYQVWSEIRKQPRFHSEESRILLPNAEKRKTLVADPVPPRFNLRLGGMLLVYWLSLGLIAISVRRAEDASLLTYIYLVPSSQLMECQKRAFFVKTVGPQVLYNVEIALRDNKSGTTVTQTYDEIDPEPQQTGKYFLFSPSSRWDEDYTANIRTRDSHSSQRLVVRSTKKQIQFAMETTVGDAKKIVLKCRDGLLPDTYSLAAGERRACTELMELPQDVPTQLDVVGYQLPDGRYTILKMPKRPSPSELDDQSDDRHLTEYQEQLMHSILKKYERSRLAIYYAGGDKSRRYATEFRQFFSERWNVIGPDVVPVGDEQIIDVQTTVGVTTTQTDRVRDLLDAFAHAGIKHRKRNSADPAVPNDLIVLWVGPKSPKDANPDQCMGAELRPNLNEPHTCDWAAVGQGCPFPPP